MGADTFIDEEVGANAQRAFENAVEKARYNHGHAGYTGTIGEKNEYTMISLPKDKDAHKYANELILEGDERIDDKWGPAGCIELGERKFLFFGWASS